jgi:hypothetical protein
VAAGPGLGFTNRLHRALSLEQKRRFFYGFFERARRVDGRWVVDFGDFGLWANESGPYDRSVRGTLN